MLEPFCSFLREQGKAENTVKAYCLAVSGYMRWYADSYGVPAGQLCRADVLEHISYLRTERKLANRSVNSKLAALQCYNEFLIQTGIQKDLILSKRDYLKVQTAYANPSTVSREQVESFRRRVLAGSGKRNYAIVTVLAYAGLRISECLALLPEDVSLTAKEITVRQGKGAKTRVVFIGGQGIVAGRGNLAGRPGTRRPKRVISRRGGALSRGQVNRIFNAYSSTITPHTLRHFFCSTAIEAGYSINEVANQAGHSNIQTTLLYTNPTREKMKEKANLL